MVHKRFLIWLLAAILAWWPALHALVRIAIADENYSYTLLVLGVSIVLLVLERWPAPLDRKPSLLLISGLLVLLAAGVFLSFRAPFAPGSARLTLSILLWIVFVLSAFAGIYGRNAFAQMRFPFLFSLLAVPLPARCVSAVITGLQWGSADAAYGLLRLFRVPVVRSGLEFSFSKLDIVVAEECSSIRSSTILLVTTIVLAHLVLKSTPNKWIAALVAVPVGVFKNGVRIFTLSVLGEYVSVGWLDSPLHHQGGFIFLSLGLAIMIGVIALLWRMEGRRTRGTGGECVEKRPRRPSN